MCFLGKRAYTSHEVKEKKNYNLRSRSDRVVDAVYIYLFVYIYTHTHGVFHRRPRCATTVSRPGYDNVRFEKKKKMRKKTVLNLCGTI